MIRVGIQGIKASFHDVSARKFMEGQDIEIAEASSFKKLCEDLAQGNTDYAVMAIENTIAGSILTNYNLLERYRLNIVAENYLKISMQLMALPGTQLKDIRTVRSHPIALLQCEDFFAEHPHIQLIEGKDTAACARDLVTAKDCTQAAVASRLAANEYGLEILSSDIQTNKRNYTRFLLLCRGVDFQSPKDANKASLRFETGNSSGSLAAVLDIFKKWNINLTKLQSVPILGRPYSYSFHVDLIWQKPTDYEAAMEELSRGAKRIIHFGEYRLTELPHLPGTQE